jgi:hypothetical protein
MLLSHDRYNRLSRYMASTIPHLLLNATQPSIEMNLKILLWSVSERVEWVFGSQNDTWAPMHTVERRGNL